MGVGIWAVFACLFAAVAGLVLIPVHPDLPVYAMDSALLFRLERALAIAALLILPALVIGPLLSGALPQKLSSDGIDWGEDRATVVETLGNVHERLNALEGAIAEIAELNDG